MTDGLKHSSFCPSKAADGRIIFDPSDDVSEGSSAYADLLTSGGRGAL